MNLGLVTQFGVIKGRLGRRSIWGWLQPQMAAQSSEGGTGKKHFLPCSKFNCPAGMLIRMASLPAGRDLSNWVTNLLSPYKQEPILSTVQHSELSHPLTLAFWSLTSNKFCKKKKKSQINSYSNNKNTRKRQNTSQKDRRSASPS